MECSILGQPFIFLQGSPPLRRLRRPRSRSDGRSSKSVPYDARPRRWENVWDGVAPALRRWSTTRGGSLPKLLDFQGVSEPIPVAPGRKHLKEALRAEAVPDSTVEEKPIVRLDRFLAVYLLVAEGAEAPDGAPEGGRGLHGRFRPSDRHPGIPTTSGSHRCGILQVRPVLTTDPEVRNPTHPGSFCYGLRTCLPLRINREVPRPERPLQRPTTQTDVAGWGRLWVTAGLATASSPLERPPRPT